MKSFKKFRITSFVCAALLLATLFQNCGPGFQVQSLSSLNSNNIAGTPTDFPAEEAPFTFNENEITSNFRGSAIKINFSIKNVQRAAVLSIKTVDSTAVAGTDFARLSRSITLDSANPTANVSIETLIPDPLAATREFGLQIDYNDRQGNPKTYVKTIQIKSRFEAAKYKSIKSGYSNMCGLGFDDQTYCWGKGSGTDYTVNPGFQPIRIIPLAGSQIDFESLQIGDAFNCFRVNPSRDIFCNQKMNLAADGVTASLTTESKVAEGSAIDWVVSGYMFYSINASGILQSKHYQRPEIQDIDTNVRYKKIYRYNYASVLAITDNDSIRGIDSLGATAAVTSFATTILSSQIKASDGYSILNDGRVVLIAKEYLLQDPKFSETYRSVSTGPSQFVEFEVAEPAQEFVSPRCVLSTLKNVFCRNFLNTKFELVPSLDLQELKLFFVNYSSINNEQPLVRNLPEYINTCGLKTDGSLFCRGRETYSDRYGYNFSNGFQQYRDISADWIESNFAGYTANDPLAIETGQTTALCSVSGDSVVTCWQRKIFGDQKIKPGTLKSFKTASNFNGGISNYFIFAETQSGRLLGYGYFPTSKQSFFPIYRQLKELGATTPF